MKKIVVLTTLILSMAVASPLMAEESHHPAAGDTSTAQQEEVDQKLDASMMKLQEMRRQMGMTKGDSERNNMMHEHMQMMRKGMQMMDMMGDDSMEGREVSGKSEAERLTRLEMKLRRMEKLLGSTGAMNSCGMMPDGLISNPRHQRLRSMENRMQMMQEMMKGMISQQEMMMEGR